MSLTGVPLKQILKDISECPPDYKSVPITGVTSDSREVKPGYLFVAVVGATQNGETFIDNAVERGAAAIVTSQTPTKVTSVPVFKVLDSRLALAFAARNFYGDPANSLRIFGVTGTNGKTTTCWLLHQALSSLNKKTLRLGTAGNYLEGVLDEEAKLTTLDPVVLHKLFALAVKHHAIYATLEASSHALDQRRLAGVPFEVAIFTNLTRDHLDYHQTFEAYELAKRKIIDLLKPDGCIVINFDDPCGERFARYAQDQRRRVLTFGRRADADVSIVSNTSDVVFGTKILLTLSGSQIELTTPLLGDFNTENVVGVFCALLGAGFSSEEAVLALRDAHGAPGRLERIHHAGRTAFVDYAHTPDALERALRALRPMTSGKLSVVFGCGGDRDRGKRPIMGEIATRLADRVFVTSDNPRSESPESIVAEIAKGAPNASIEVDRASAISKAVAVMESGDVVLVAGKGHENYQILKTGTIHFSDQEVVKSALTRSFS